MSARPDIIRAIYGETFSFVKPGGCFLNFDHMTPSLKIQIKWLRDAGFEDVKSFWDGGSRALVGGFKRNSGAADVRRINSRGRIEFRSGIGHALMSSDLKHTA